MGDLPAPARALLADERGMTACLAGRYGDPVGLRVLARVHQGTRYARQVVLTAGDDGRALALAAVELDLDRVPPDVRTGVLAERVPLGALLAAAAPAFRRVVAATFRVRRDAVLADALGPAAPPWCHGRRTLLLAPGSRLAATMIEVVPL